MARRFEPVSLGSPTFVRAEVGAFQITHARFPAGLVLPPHVHERACVATTHELDLALRFADDVWLLPMGGPVVVRNANETTRADVLAIAFASELSR